MTLPSVMPAAFNARWITSGKSLKTVSTASAAPRPATAVVIFSSSAVRKNAL